MLEETKREKDVWTDQKASEENKRGNEDQREEREDLKKNQWLHQAGANKTWESKGRTDRGTGTEFHKMAMSNMRNAASDLATERERERFEGGSSAVASNSVYPLWKEEDTVWMDNKTDRRTAELSPDLQQQSAEITETKGRRAGQKVKEEDSWIFDLIRLRMHGRHKPEECFLHSAISCLRPLRGQETNKQEFT